MSLGQVSPVSGVEFSTKLVLATFWSCIWTVVSRPLLSHLCSSFPPALLMFRLLAIILQISNQSLCLVCSEFLKVYLFIVENINLDL